MDLIDRKALTEKLYEKCKDGEVLYRISPSDIENAPTVEAEPVRHGEWEFDSFTAQYGKPYRCSECKEEYGDTHNYCPNCGAKMDGD